MQGVAENTGWLDSPSSPGRHAAMGCPPEELVNLIKPAEF